MRVSFDIDDTLVCQPTVAVVSPDDPDWSARVLEAVDRKTGEIKRLVVPVRVSDHAGD
jgi:hypothetical protein